jgi:Rrf2 family iron-sulfur cluster assembly transcriptional regulator
VAVSVADIIAAVNEPIKATRCKDGSMKSCMGRDGRCIVHGLWVEMGDRIQGFLADVTLADLVAGRFNGAASAKVAAE